MALLPDDEKKKQEQAAAGTPAAPVTPTAPVAPVTSASQAPAPVAAAPKQSSAVPAPQAVPMAPVTSAQPAPQRKGTGFTNLNRIMQANQGNKLGSTVAGGVSQAGQNLQSGVAQSQSQFQTDADKARIDTQANIDKRAGILGRFDPSTYKVDESKFQVSGGLTSQYEQNKAAQTAAQQQAKADLDLNQAAINKQIAASQDAVKKFEAGMVDQRPAQLAAAQAKMDSLPKYSTEWRAAKDEVQRATDAVNSRESTKDWFDKVGKMNDLKRLKEGVGQYQGLSATMQSAFDASQADAAKNLANLESQYGEMSKAEKDQFMKSETDRLMAENAPTEAEIADFSNLQSGTYTGPKELGDYQTLLGKAQNVESLGTNARSVGGRQELLKQFVGGRDYTAGQRGLDEAILGQDKTSLLSKAAKSVRGAEKSVAGANKLAGAKAQELLGKAKAFGEETQGMIADKRKGISGTIDEQLKQLQDKETGRVGDVSKLQGILSGTDPKVAGMDSTTRAGVALQSAMDAGYLSPQEAEQLVGSGGLIQRATAAGLDPNALLGERLKSIAAVGADRRAAATGGQEGIISAMDRLAGKVGTDVEFGTGKEQYQAGKTGFDVASLRDYIAKTEAEKMKDPAYAAELQKAGLSPLQQIMGGAGQILGQANTSGGIGAALAPGLAGAGIGAAYGGLAGAGAGALGGYGMAGVAPIAAAGMIGADLLSGGDSAAKTAEGLVQSTSGLANIGMSGNDAILKALAKYAPAGSQISKVLDYKTQLQQKGLGELTKEGMNMADGLRDLTQTGRLDQALAKLTGADAIKNLYSNAGREVGKAVSNVGGSVKKALFGGSTGDLLPHEVPITDASTGERVQVGSFANKSSQEILKQLVNQQVQTGGKFSSKQSGTGVTSELLRYYNEAKAREQG